MMQDTNDQLTKLVLEHHDALERYALRKVDGDPKYRTLAEDAVQVAFIKAYLNPEKIAQSPNPYGWLAVCCRNYIRSNLRKQKNRAKITGTPVSLEVCHSVEDPTDAIIRWMDAAASRELRDAIYESLTDKEKAVFRDYYERSCSLKETAARNAMSGESVRGAVQRIRSKAKKFRFPMMIILIGQCILRFLRTI